MRFIKLLFLCCLLQQFGFAQDTLFYRNGNLKIVKVTEITESYVAFFKLESEGGAPFKVPSSAIESVSFSNGRKVVVSNIKDDVADKKEEVNTDNKFETPGEKKARLEADSLEEIKFRRRKLSIMVCIPNLVLRNVNVNFDVWLGKNTFSLYVPFVVGVDAVSNVPDYDRALYFPTRKVFTAGIGFKYHFINRRKSTMFILPLAEVGVGKVMIPDCGWQNNTITQNPIYINTSMQIYSLSLGSTYLFNHFQITLYGGLSLRHEKSGYDYDTFVSNNKSYYESLGYGNTAGITRVYVSKPQMSYQSFPFIRMGFMLGYWF